MERIRNLISPRTRRKKLDLGVSTDGMTITPTPKIFGISLHDLMLREPASAAVPLAVTRICEYIYKFGLDHIGLFRVSGSVRVVEKMRMQFDLTGDVNFEEENDVAATAGLLKVFLRDLPETLVPAELTHRFFSIVKDSKLTNTNKLEMMKNTLRLLPEEHFQLLKYISSLLVVVADNEAENKMSAFTLAILFGPNVFTYQVTSNLEGMKDMDTSKDVMQLFISHYQFLFAEEGEPIPKEFWEKCRDKRKIPPTRPPPPKISSPLSESSFPSSNSSPNLGEHRPVPSPRKIKPLVDNHSSCTATSTAITSSNVESEEEENTAPFVSFLHSQLPDTVPLFSPREELDHSRSHSPFGFESDTHSIIESPMVTARTSEFVEKTIVETISEHIFGILDVNQNSGNHSSKSLTNTPLDDMDSLDGTSVDIPVVKPRTSLANKNRQNPSSSSQSSSENPKDNRDSQEFDDLQSSQLLTTVKKTQGPPRRSPSLKHRRHSLDGSSVDMSSSPGYSSNDTNSQLNNNCFFLDNVDQIVVMDNGNNHGGNYWNNDSRDKLNVHMGKEGDEEVSDKKVLVIHEVDDTDGKGDVMSVEKKVKSRRSYADVVNGWTSPGENENIHQQESLSSRHVFSSSSLGEMNGDRLSSATTTALTLLIPPLDLSTLHEHVDGIDARPVSNIQVQAWVNKPEYLTVPDDQNTPVVSPRSSKMKKRNGPLLQMPAAVYHCGGEVVEAPMSPSAYGGPVPLSASSNTDIPPSPPIHQDLYKKHSDDECSHRLRQLTKKIQGLKKRIKAFEESFEKIHGYRPSQGERASQPEIKKFMTELSKARKDLKQLKENTEKTNRSRHNSGASSSGMEMSPPVIPTVASTLEIIMHGLKEKRQEASRPEEMVLMSRDQIQQEKLDVQKALLRFEGLHGRPSTKEEKDLMRPLYDRYRQIKRTLAKPVSPRNSLELQTVPEEHVMEIPRTFNRAPIHVPTAYVDEENEGDNPGFGTADCFGIVTRDFSRSGSVKDHMVLHDIDLPPQQELAEDEMGDEEEEWPGRKGDKGTQGDAHLHELSLPELHVEIETSRKEKKKLRKILREFEEDFLIQHGRKVQKEDRHPLQTEYSDYKKVKARMRLLEALVLKHHE